MIQGIATATLALPGSVLDDDVCLPTVASQRTLLVQHCNRDGKTIWEAKPQARLVGDP